MGRIKTTDSAQGKHNRADMPHLWKPGTSGNPSGRPVGSRNKLTENILSDLAEFYEREGLALIEKVRDENPGLLLQSLIKLVPKEAHLNISGGAILSLTVEQRERIAESWLISKTDGDVLEGVAVRIEPDKKVLKHDDSEKPDKPARVKRVKASNRISSDPD